MSGTLERVYAMKRNGPGDWSLPSNDGKRSYRLIRYPEHDGTLQTDDGRVIRGWFWLVGRWNILSGGYGDLDVIETGMRTRAEAIHAALSWDAQLMERVS